MYRAGLLLVICLLVGAAAQGPSLPIGSDARGAIPIPQPSTSSNGDKENGALQGSAQKESSPDNSHQESQSDQRGTKTMPLTVKLLNTGKSDAEATQEANTVKEHTQLDTWVGKWTIRLTSALVLATVLQFGALLYQGYWVRRSVKGAEYVITKGQRPYVFVFNVFQFKAEWIDVADSYAYMLPFTVANYGTMPATIEDVHFSIGGKDGGPIVLKLIDRSYLFVTSPIFTIGERRDDSFPVWPWSIKLKMYHSGHPESPEISVEPVDASEIFFWIVVKYRGVFTGGHECSYCWRYDRESHHFVEYGGAAYNYAK